MATLTLQREDAFVCAPQRVKSAEARSAVCEMANQATISGRDYDDFVTTCKTPPALTERMKRAAKNYATKR